MTRFVLFTTVVLAAFGLAEIVNVLEAWSSHQPDDFLEPRNLTMQIMQHSLIVLVTIGMLAWMSGWNILPALGATFMVGMIAAMAAAMGAFMGIVMMAADDPQGVEVLEAVTSSYTGWQLMPFSIYMFTGLGAAWTLWRNFAEDRLLVS
jgi:ABC-type xylose transport system permease subunit